MNTLNGFISNRSLFVAVMVFVVLGLTLTAQATLIDRGNGLIFDTDFDLIWQQNANLAETNTFGVVGIRSDGFMDWFTANDWIAAMNVANYKGFTDWRLTTLLNRDGSGPCSGLNCTGSELGHLWYSELGNLAGGPLLNTGPFTNLQTSFYWSSTEFAPSSPGAGGFNTIIGNQGTNIDKFSDGYIWAVRDGDVTGAPLPEPSTMLLFGTGLAGLALWRYLQGSNA